VKKYHNLEQKTRIYFSFKPPFFYTNFLLNEILKTSLPFVDGAVE